MHELSICQSLVGIVEDEARRHVFRSVARIRVEVGPFAAIEPDALRFAFDVAAAGTVCAGAALEILAVPGSGWCFECDAAVEIRDRLGRCPACGGSRLTAGDTDTLRIKDLEVV